MDLFNFLFINNWAFREASLLIFGLCIGSFLNVIIYRLPIMLLQKWRNECAQFMASDANKKCNLSESNIPFNLIRPASHCPNCKQKIPAWANVPLIGYLVVKGKCHLCNTRIPLRYPLVELLTGILFVGAGLIFIDNWLLFGSLIFIAVTICLVFIDFDTLLLPDELTLLLVWLGLLFNLNGKICGNLVNAVIGAVVGYLILWIIYWLFKLVTKKEGMGYGDFKLLAGLGAWLGWQSLIGILLLSSFLGIIYAVCLRFSGKLALGNPIPFGPFLGAAGIISLFFAKYFPYTLFIIN